MNFRPKTRVGLWLPYLLPLALILATKCTTSSEKSALILALSTTLYSSTFALESLIPFKTYLDLFLAPSARISLQTNGHFKNMILPLVILMALSLVVAKLGVLVTALSSVAFMAFVLLLPRFFETFQKSFSYGEGSLVLQSLTCYAIKSLIGIINDEHDPSTIEGSFCIISNTGLTSLLALCGLSCAPGFGILNKPSAFYVSGVSLVFGFLLPYLWWSLKRDPIAWVIHYILASKKLMLLFAFWGLCGLLAIVIVMKQKTLATTSVRKYFHALVVIVFTSGCLVDPHFLYLSSVVVLCLMLLLEHIRFRKLEPIASLLKEAFAMFQDEKDQGQLVLTNIYLLVGVSLPLWLMSDLSGNPLPLLSGVLSLGVGDSFASIVGSRIGRIKLWGSDKTFEGLVASILSQLVFVAILHYFQLTLVTPLTMIPIIVVSSVEAITSHVDNLVLPFLMLILMLKCT